MLATVCWGDNCSLFDCLQVAPCYEPGSLFMQTCKTHKRETIEWGVGRGGGGTGEEGTQAENERSCSSWEGICKRQFHSASSRRAPRVNHTRWDGILVIDFISIRSIWLTFFHTLLFFYCGMKWAASVMDTGGWKWEPFHDMDKQFLR